jgi:hypothetical protein
MLEECVEARVSRCVFRLPTASADKVLAVLEGATQVASAFEG